MCVCVWRGTVEPGGWRTALRPVCISPPGPAGLLRAAAAVAQTVRTSVCFSSFLEIQKTKQIYLTIS